MQGSSTPRLGTPEEGTDGVSCKHRRAQPKDRSKDLVRWYIQHCPKYTPCVVSAHVDPVRLGVYWEGCVLLDHQLMCEGRSALSVYFQPFSDKSMPKALHSERRYIDCEDHAKPR
eukprot:6808886-Pyramimonas_sp.AAC.2